MPIPVARFRGPPRSLRDRILERLRADPSMAWGIEEIVAEMLDFDVNWFVLGLSREDVREKSAPVVAVLRELDREGLVEAFDVPERPGVYFALRTPA